MKIKKKNGLVYIPGMQESPMTRAQYEQFRAERIEDGEDHWPLYDAIPEDESDAEYESPFSPSP